MDIYLNGYSSLTSNGVISSIKENFSFDDGESPITIGRKRVFDKIHTGFGKLNPPDKLAFSVASLILDCDIEIDSENTGISLGSTTGSFSTDLRYMESVAEGFPSPAYFQATLPSSPVAEVAILFKLKGPDRSFVSTKGAGIDAILGAERILKLKKASSVLVIFINGTDTQDKNHPFINKTFSKQPFGFGLLLSSKKIEKSLNFIIKSDFYTNKNIQDDDEEAYFLKLIENIDKTGTFNGSCNINKKSIELHIKKEI